MLADFGGIWQGNRTAMPAAFWTKQAESARKRVPQGFLAQCSQI
tara:strand:- start:1238 stop:1369 length:132 start_codon:yes stop_codon:yes gene_type:complete